MSERLSWEEIKRRYPDEWVILTEAVFEEGVLDPLEGCVYDHDKDKGTLVDRFDHKPKKTALWFTGVRRHWRLAV